MSIPEGTGPREFTASVRHVTNGDPGNQNTFRAATVDLEKRSLALFDFANALETFVYALLGNDINTVSGVQGNYNSNHVHNGTGSSLIDMQRVYNNGDDDAVLNIATNGSFTINLNNGTSLVVNSDDGTQLLKVDNDTKQVFIGALQQQFS